MKLDIFRLISIDPYGVGNEENALVDLLYSYFLGKNGLDHYREIKVNQVHQEQGIEEFVDIEDKYVHVNIIFNTDPNFDNLDDLSKNKIRLDLIHAGLLRFAEKDNRYPKSILEDIRNEILRNNFNLELLGQVQKNPYDESISYRLVIRPQTKYFEYFFLIQKEGKDLCKIPVYKGKANTFYLAALFSKVMWKTKNKVVIEGLEEQMQMTLDSDNCNLTFQNLTEYSKPPLWEMSRADISDQDNLNAYENWIHSLPPGYAAILNNNQN
jgi:hypothetical protein